MENLEKNVKFLAKYPFLEESKKYVADKNLSLEEIINHPIYSRAVEVARQRVEDGINGKIKYVPRSELDSEIWLISFPIARILINFVPHMLKKYANSEADLAISLLEKDEKKDIVLKKIINYEKQENLSDLNNLNKINLNKINFIEYLKYSSKIPEERFRLVNRTLDKGFILIDDQDMLKLAKEAIQEKFEAKIELKNIPEKFNEIAKSFAKSFEKYVEKYEIIPASVKEKQEHPPCITALISRIKTGEVSHQGRFLLATYLINANLSIEKIKKIFSESSKYDEKKTTYYLEYLSGTKGKKYSCPACSKIKSFGLCVAECKIKHPLQYKEYKEKTA